MPHTSRLPGVATLARMCAEGRACLFAYPALRAAWPPCAPNLAVRRGIRALLFRSARWGEGNANCRKGAAPGVPSWGQAGRLHSQAAPLPAALLCTYTPCGLSLLGGESGSQARQAGPTAGVWRRSNGARGGCPALRGLCRAAERCGGPGQPPPGAGGKEPAGERAGAASPRA